MGKDMFEMNLVGEQGGFVVICAFCVAVLYFDGWKQKNVSILGIVCSLVIGGISLLPLSGKEGTALAINVIWAATWFISAGMKLVRYCLNRGKSETEEAQETKEE